eukprot:11398130-Heterocapsa_arctica.AAC.1
MGTRQSSGGRREGLIGPFRIADGAHRNRDGVARCHSLDDDQVVHEFSHMVRDGLYGSSELGGCPDGDTEDIDDVEGALV